MRKQLYKIMKLEKFNLEKALSGAKVVTRDGREVSELTKFESASYFSLAGVLNGSLQTWTDTGHFDTLLTQESDRDLFLFGGQVRRAWVNIYGNGRDIITSSGGYRTREDAIRNIREDYEYIKTIEITDEL
jgi:hypothetical protein